MRLIDSRNPNRLRFVEFFGDQVPPYAILSHTWSENGHEEVAYLDIIDGVGQHKSGYRKIDFCVNKANQLCLRTARTAYLMTADQAPLKTPSRLTVYLIVFAIL